MSTIRRVAGFVLWIGVAVSPTFPARSATPEEQSGEAVLVVLEVQVQQAAMWQLPPAHIAPRHASWGGIFRLNFTPSR
jgi:hypothetical protein